MVARSRARYLAPIALIATIAGTYVIVHSTLNPPKSATVRSHTVTNPSTTTVKRRFAKAKYYYVHSGDSMTSIAAKTGIPLTTLEDLNHSVQPDALQTGQRLRLRR
jgi:LysM repeat protein